MLGMLGTATFDEEQRAPTFWALFDGGSAGDISGETFKLHDG